MLKNENSHSSTNHAVEWSFVKAGKSILVLITGAILFAVSLRPVTTYDTFFGLKIAQLITQTGHIPSQEVFSWAAYGRHWVAYEWLAQILAYGIYQLGGLEGLTFYVSIVFVCFFFLAFVLFRYILDRDAFSSFALALFLFAATYEFFVARPQIIAYILFLAITTLIFLYIKRGKNWLVLSVPLTYIWTNAHASFIFVPYLFLSFAAILYVQKRKEGKKKEATDKARLFLLFAFLTTLVTILPPLFFGPYQLLLDFTKDLSFLTTFLTEWNSLATEPAYLIFYWSLLITTLTILILAYKRKSETDRNILFALPFLPIALSSSQAIRHIPFAALSLIIPIALLLPNINSTTKGWTKKITLAFLLFLIGLSCFFIQTKRDFALSTSQETPTEIIPFLQTHKLNGHMYNDFALGGYLVYYLYPQYQVFYDGRADIYHCCEMRDFWNLFLTKKDSAKFRTELTRFLEKHKFSYLILTNVKSNPLEHTVNSLISDTLIDQPDWRMVFFSDRAQILVKRDGQNDTLFDTLGFTSITPFRLKPFKTGNEEGAIQEYERMIRTQDSSTAQLGLGAAYLSLQQVEKAKEHFRKAESLDPKDGRTYLGLGQVAMEEKNYALAIQNLQKAIDQSPYVGEAYLLLAQNYRAVNRQDEAVLILEKGLQQPIDFLTKQKIAQLLQKIRSGSL